MDQAAFPHHPDQAKTPYFIDIATSLPPNQTVFNLGALQTNLHRNMDGFTGVAQEKWGHSIW
jgi:hypothetical protein